MAGRVIRRRRGGVLVEDKRDPNFAAKQDAKKQIQQARLDAASRFRADTARNKATQERAIGAAERGSAAKQKHIASESAAARRGVLRERLLTKGVRGPDGKSRPATKADFDRLDQLMGGGGGGQATVGGRVSRRPTLEQSQANQAAIAKRRGAFDTRQAEIKQQRQARVRTGGRRIAAVPVIPHGAEADVQRVLRAFPGMTTLNENPNLDTQLEKQFRKQIQVATRGAAVRQQVQSFQDDADRAKQKLAGNLQSLIPPNVRMQLEADPMLKAKYDALIAKQAELMSQTGGASRQPGVSGSTTGALGQQASQAGQLQQDVGSAQNLLQSLAAQDFNRIAGAPTIGGGIGPATDTTIPAGVPSATQGPLNRPLFGTLRGAVQSEFTPGDLTQENLFGAGGGFPLLPPAGDVAPDSTYPQPPPNSGPQPGYPQPPPNTGPQLTPVPFDASGASAAAPIPGVGGFNPGVPSGPTPRFNYDYSNRTAPTPAPAGPASPARFQYNGATRVNTPAGDQPVPNQTPPIVPTTPFDPRTVGQLGNFAGGGQFGGGGAPGPTGLTGAPPDRALRPTGLESLTGEFQAPANTITAPTQQPTQLEVAALLRRLQAQNPNATLQQAAAQAVDMGAPQELVASSLQAIGQFERSQRALRTGTPTMGSPNQGPQQPGSVNPAGRTGRAPTDAGGLQFGESQDEILNRQTIALNNEALRKAIGGAAATGEEDTAIKNKQIEAASSQINNLTNIVNTAEGKIGANSLFQGTSAEDTRAIAAKVAQQLSSITDFAQRSGIKAAFSLDTNPTIQKLNGIISEVSNSTAFGEGKDAQVQMLTLIRSMLQSGEAQPVPGSLGTAGGGLGSTALESILSTVVPGASTVTRNARALR